VANTRQHLFCHCSRWRDQQKTLRKRVGQATGWKAGRCQHVKISGLLTIEECDQAVMDFLAATEVGKFQSKSKSGTERPRVLKSRGRCWR
jgi:hypothetical protein